MINIINNLNKINNLNYLDKINRYILPPKIDYTKLIDIDKKSDDNICDHTLNICDDPKICKKYNICCYSKNR